MFLVENGYAVDGKDVTNINDPKWYNLIHNPDGGYTKEILEWVASLEEYGGMSEFIRDSSKTKLPHTIENASMVMRQKGKQGIGVGAPEAAQAARLMKSKDEIRHEEDRLVSERREVVNYDRNNDLEGEEYVRAVQYERPTKYFETKFERPVKFNEFAAAVVPEDTPADVVDFLRSQGLQIETYERDNDASRRAAMDRATQKEGVRFSVATSTDEFDSTVEQALASYGIVMPGLRTASVKAVDIPNHDFKGSRRTAINAAKGWAKEQVETWMKEDKLKAVDSKGRIIRYDIDLKKMLSDEAINNSANTGLHLAILKKLPQVVAASIEVEIHPDYLKDENGGRGPKNGQNKNVLMHRFYGVVKNTFEGKTNLFRVKTTIKEYRDTSVGIKAYSYEAIKIESLEAPNNVQSTTEALLPVAMTSNDSMISVAKLLKGVEKSYDPGKKILDESEKSSEGEPAELHRFGSAMEELKLEGEERKAVRGYAEGVAREMGIEGDVEFVDGTEEGLSAEQKGAKAWFDSSTGKVTVNLANAEGAADVEMSLLHEGAGHKGLRAMFGERFKQFLGNVWDAMPEELRRRAFEGARKYGWDLHTGTEEVLSEMAEKGEFKKYDKFFNRLKGFFGAMLRASGLRSGELSTHASKRLRFSRTEGDECK